jgi:hypothetical protein
VLPLAAELQRTPVARDLERAENPELDRRHARDYPAAARRLSARGQVGARPGGEGSTAESRWQPATQETAIFPRDLVDEIERELATARVAVSADRARIAALEELQVLVLVHAATRGRPTTAQDLLGSAPSDPERERRRRLLALLR